VIVIGDVPIVNTCGLAVVAGNFLQTTVRQPYKKEEKEKKQTGV
jgi:hypothetical protein